MRHTSIAGTSLELKLPPTVWKRMGGTRGNDPGFWHSNQLC